MAASRANLVVGPARCTLGTASFYSLDDFEVRIDTETFEVRNTAYGRMDHRTRDARVECTVTPEGAWVARNVPELWPYSTTQPGASIFTGSDVPLVIEANDGAKHSIIAAAITRMPSLFLSATRTMIGPMTFTGLRGVGKAWADADGLYKIETGGQLIDNTNTPLALANIKTQPYTAAWSGKTGFTSFEAAEGWTIDFDMETAPVVVDSMGTLDLRLVSVGVMARCIPIGPTTANILAALDVNQAASNRPGASFAALGADLVITGADATTVVTLHSAMIRTAGYRFGTSVLREGEIGFVANRELSSSAMTDLWTLAPAT